MNEIRIPEEQWWQFCEGFTRQHHGWLVGMRQVPTRALESGGSPGEDWGGLYAGHLPLLEVREGSTDDDVELMVTVGQGVEKTSFLIARTVALYNRKLGNAHQGLRIDSANGTSTLLEFRSPAKPETLDGLPVSEA